MPTISEILTLVVAVIVASIPGFWAMRENRTRYKKEPMVHDASASDTYMVAAQKAADYAVSLQNKITELEAKLAEAMRQLAIERDARIRIEQDFADFKAKYGLMERRTGDNPSYDGPKRRKTDKKDE